MAYGSPVRGTIESTDLAGSPGMIHRVATAGTILAGSTGTVKSLPADL